MKLHVQKGVNFVKKGEDFRKKTATKGRRCKKPIDGTANSLKSVNWIFRGQTIHQYDFGKE